MESQDKPSMSATTMVLIVLLIVLVIVLVSMAFYYRNKLRRLGLQAAEGAQRVMKYKHNVEVAGIDNPIYGMPSPNNTRIPISGPIFQDGGPTTTTATVAGAAGGITTPPTQNVQLDQHNNIAKSANPSKNVNQLGATAGIDANKVDNKQIERDMLSNMVESGYSIPVRVALPHDGKDGPEEYFYDRSKLGESDQDDICEEDFNKIMQQPAKF
ncbi:uncharacterized protein LOC106878575 [Octopus bimaculoides]|uniref:Uncharacterized protein n=1 Tax=Octopus bimaculoides TaxID=37653 RepID=A0A0L8G861_OCTBM|nr:uncharacterized protein LOC106878575 [Octopus bimaculoides]|eukprot:XP_014783307.1 PREDICTED: uncharacterized protein LOC106878575 [Octopus bimaculoides]